MRITESRLRRIIRSIIAESLSKKQESSYFASPDPDSFNKRCQDYYINPFGKFDHIVKFDYYNKLKDVFEKGGNMQDYLEDIVKELGLTDKLGGKGSKNDDCDLFVNKLYHELDPESRNANLNELLGLIIDL